MGTITRLTFEEFQRLPEREGVIYELDEGALLSEPSRTPRHNLIRQFIAMQLMEFVQSEHLGIVLDAMDFRLGLATVRNPDVAFVTTEHLKKVDLDRSPVDGAPALAVEVISPNNRAEDIAKKTQQYLNVGCKTVWIIYPSLRLAEIHSTTGVRTVKEPERLQDELLSGFSLALSHIFDAYQQQQ